MADRYWNPASSPANWSSTSSWSTTDGGSTGASVPTSSDDAYFTSTNNNNCVVDGVSYVKNLDFGNWAGTFSANVVGHIYIYGNFIASEFMNFAHDKNFRFEGTADSVLQTKGVELFHIWIARNSGSVTLLDDLTLTRNASSFGLSGTIHRASGSLDTNENTIFITGENAWIGGNLTFYSLEKTSIGQVGLFQGSTCTIQNSIQVDGNLTTNQVIRTNSAGTQATLHNATGSPITLEYCDIKDINFTGDGWVALDCVDGGNNTGITFSTLSLLYEMSADGGVTWVETNLNELVTFPNPGSDLRIRVTADDTLKIKKITCKYNLLTQ